MLSIVKPPCCQMTISMSKLDWNVLGMSEQYVEVCRKEGFHEYNIYD